MELLLVRHAIAPDRDPKRWPRDDERPLTPQGRRRFREVAAGLAAFCPPVNRLYTSPLRRADETATILTESAGWPAARMSVALRPETKPAATLAWLVRQKVRGRAAMVGHEPHLHEFAAFLLGAPKARLEFKKGGVASLSFESVPKPGGATLRWLAPPRILRRLAP